MFCAFLVQLCTLKFCRNWPKNKHSRLNLTVREKFHPWRDNWRNKPRNLSKSNARWFRGSFERWTKSWTISRTKTDYSRAEIHALRGHRERRRRIGRRRDTHEAERDRNGRRERERISATTRRLDGIVNFVEELLNFSKSRSLSLSSFLSPPATHLGLIN